MQLSACRSSLPKLIFYAAIFLTIGRVSSQKALGHHSQLLLTSLGVSVALMCIVFSFQEFVTYNIKRNKKGAFEWTQSVRNTVSIFEIHSA